MTFTLQAKVNDNLAARTPLYTTATTTYTGKLNNGSSDDGSTAAIASSSVADFTSGLSITGESNGNTSAVSITAPQTTISATIGDIVRVHAYVQVPEGQNSNSVLNVALPTGLQFVSDNSVTVALVSPGADLKSSTLDPTGTNGALQVSEAGGQIDPTKTA